jgi:hypothetical protein
MELHRGRSRPPVSRTARKLWREIAGNLKSDMTSFYPTEVDKATTLDAKIDKLN